MVHVGVDLHKRVFQIAVLTGDRGGRSTRPDDGNLKENRPVHCKKTGGPQPRVLATPRIQTGLRTDCGDEPILHRGGLPA